MICVPLEAPPWHERTLVPSACRGRGLLARGAPDGDAEALGATGRRSRGLSAQSTVACANRPRQNCHTGMRPSRGFLPCPAFPSRAMSSVASVARDGLSEALTNAEAVLSVSSSQVDPREARHLADPPGLPGSRFSAARGAYAYPRRYQHSQPGGPSPSQPLSFGSPAHGPAAPCAPPHARYQQPQQQQQPPASRGGGPFQHPEQRHRRPLQQDMQPGYYLPQAGHPEQTVRRLPLSSPQNCRCQAFLTLPCPLLSRCSFCSRKSPSVGSILILRCAPHLCPSLFHASCSRRPPRRLIRGGRGRGRTTRRTSATSPSQQP